MNKEQAAEQFVDCYYAAPLVLKEDELITNAFIAGATWQEQQSHSTYMEFAEWYHAVLEDVHALFQIMKLCGEYYTTPDLFQYWIDNVKKKG